MSDEGLKAINDVKVAQLRACLALYQKLHGLTDDEKWDKLDELWKDATDRGLTSNLSKKDFCISILLEELDCQTDRKKEPKGMVI